LTTLSRSGSFHPIMRTPRTSRSRTIQPLYCLVGEDSYRKLIFLRELKGDIFPRQEEPLNYEYLLGDEATAALILDAVRTVAWDLFSTVDNRLETAKRLVVVDRAEKLSPAIWKRLRDYLADPEPNACLVFLINRASRGWTPLSLFPKKYVKTFSPLKGVKLLDWGRKEASKRNLTIPDGVLEELVLSTGNDLGKMTGELEKLSLYKDGPGVVTSEEIKEIIGVGRRGKVFDLTGLIVSGRSDEALILLNHLLDHGEAPLKILSLMVSSFRKLWLGIEAWARTENSRSVCEAAGVRFYQSDFLRQVKRMKSTAIPYIYRRLVEADDALKGGEKSPRLALERLIVDLARMDGAADLL